MIQFKVILLLILAVLPFVYANYQRTQERKNGQKSSLFHLLFKYLPQLYGVGQAAKILVKRIYNGMKRSDTFRRFFTLMVLLVMLLYQFVDFQVASTIVHDLCVGIEKTDIKTVKNCVNFSVWSPYFTKPHATMLAGCIALAFFSYEFSNKILLLLHNNNRLYCVVGLITIVIVIMTEGWMIMVETSAIILMAAYFYPNKYNEADPKGKKGIPKNENNMTEKSFREAA